MSMFELFLFGVEILLLSLIPNLYKYWSLVAWAIQVNYFTTYWHGGITVLNDFLSSLSLLVNSLPLLEATEGIHLFPTLVILHKLLVFLSELSLLSFFLSWRSCSKNYLQRQNDCVTPLRLNPKSPSTIGDPHWSHIKCPGKSFNCPC